MFNARVLALRTEGDVDAELAHVGVQTKGRPILRSKAQFRAVKLYQVGYREANIAKQEMLGSGGDVATGKGISDFTQEATEVVILGTLQAYRRWIPRMKRQPFQCRALAAEVEEALRNYSDQDSSIPFPRHPLALDHTLVMGVVNVTPDSFSDGGRFLEPGAAVAEARAMEAAGAAILDIGAESTRPGSMPVDAGEEWRRLEPVLRGVVEGAKVPVSVDTYKPEVAQRALDLGASMVNDVTGLRDVAMVKLLARTDVPAVVMHMQGDPRTMQESPQYADLLGEITAHLRERLHAAETAGVGRERLLVDPGIGFGKTVEHNLQILSRLREIRSLGRPIVVGVSRKGFIGRVTGQATPEERLAGSLAAATLAAREGAHVVRAHDVAPTVLALQVLDAVIKAKPSP